MYVKLMTNTEETLSTWNIPAVHRKKSFSMFRSLAGMTATKLSLGGNNDVIYKLFPPRKLFFGK
jgi:hypothetical protein